MRRLEKAVKINCKSKKLTKKKQICKQQNNNHHHLKNEMKLKARKSLEENVLKNMYNKPENNTQKWSNTY